MAATYVQGPYGQLITVAAPPSAGTLLTSTGWEDSSTYMQNLVAIAPAAGDANVAYGVTYEAAHIGELTLAAGTEAFEDAGAATHNQVRYIGLAGERYKFEAILTMTATEAAKNLVVAFFKNDVEATCADKISTTKVTGKTVSVQGCSVLAVNDVVAICCKSADGAVVTISKARLVFTKL